MRSLCYIRDKGAGMNVFARIGFGAAAGGVATYLMDAVTELLYTEDIARREREVQDKSASQVLAARILNALDLQPSDADVQKVASLLHWALGIKSGVLAGLLAGEGAGGGAALAVAASMFAFDEAGLWLIGAAAPPTQYPWQTNLRSVLGHAAYGISLAAAYEALRALAMHPRSDERRVGKE